MSRKHCPQRMETGLLSRKHGLLCRETCLCSWETGLKTSPQVKKLASGELASLQRVRLCAVRELPGRGGQQGFEFEDGIERDAGFAQHRIGDDKYIVRCHCRQKL